MWCHRNLHQLNNRAILPLIFHFSFVIRDVPHLAPLLQSGNAFAKIESDDIQARSIIVFSFLEESGIWRWTTTRKHHRFHQHSHLNVFDERQFVCMSRRDASTHPLCDVVVVQLSSLRWIFRIFSAPTPNRWARRSVRHIVSGNCMLSWPLWWNVMPWASIILICCFAGRANCDNLTFDRNKKRFSTHNGWWPGHWADDLQRSTSKTAQGIWMTTSRMRDASAIWTVLKDRNYPFEILSSPSMWHVRRNNSIEIAPLPRTVETHKSDLSSLTAAPLPYKAKNDGEHPIRQTMGSSIWIAKQTNWAAPPFVILLNLSCIHKRDKTTRKTI